MTHDVQWYDDAKQIIYVALRESISYEGLYQMLDACVSLLNEVSHPVAIVHNLADLRLVFNLDVVSLSKIPRHPIANHPNRLCSYFASPNLRSKVIIDVTKRLFPAMMSNVYTTETVESAVTAAREKLSRVRSDTVFND
jgi:hypothetical protein